ncbi:MAG TPA: ion channel [Streptosporangiaceae bacterium]|jgi:voltage-gated potassium channel|nr:ion channel [Streptosporangiaceae bacterium]
MLILLRRLIGARHSRHVIVLLSLAVGCVAAGGALFAWTQHIALTTGLYWAITTATTVGYGDVIAHNPAGRLVASAVMLTTIPLLAAVFALVTGAAAAAGIRRVLALAREFPAGTFRVVIGMHPAVPAILDELVRAGDAVVLVADVDPDTIPDKVHLIRRDPTQPGALRSAHPERAQHALITGPTDGDVLVSAVLLRKEAPEVPVSALVRSASVGEALRDLGIRQAVAADQLVAHTLAKSLEAPHAGDLILQLVDSEQHSLREIDPDPATVGRPLSAVRSERSGLVLGLVHEGRVIMGIGEDPVIAAGDHLLVAEPERDHVTR